MGRQIAAHAPVGLSIRVGQHQWIAAAGTCLVIGRDPAADVHLDHGQVSRQHARLWCDETGWLLEDIGSRNGTFVDGVRISTVRITGPAQVQCGDPDAGEVIELAPVREAVTGTGLFGAIEPPDSNGATVSDTTLVARPSAAQPRSVPAGNLETVTDADAAFRWVGDDRLHGGGASPSTAVPAAGPTAPPLTPRPEPDAPVIYDPMRPLPPPRPADPQLVSEAEEEADDALEVVPGRAERIFSLSLLGLALITFVAGVTPVIPIIVALSAIVIFVTLGMPHRLRREQVVERWDCLIDGAQGRGDEVLDATTAHIDRQALPFVDYEERDLAASLLRGGTRPFLVIWHDGKGRLTPYRMHVNVRDYGTNLQASWFLTYHRSVFERLKPNPLVALNLFDEQDLRAYVTAVHHGFLDAVVDLMVALGQDTSTLERKTNGFLGIS